MAPIHRLLFALAAISLLACESQVTPRYAGEPLLSLSGIVTMADDITDDALVPTLAFENRDLGQLEIVDTEVEGEFPSKFSLRVYAPPPAAALMEGTSGAPRYALGYISAATIHHPSRRRVAEGTSELGRCDQQACYIDYEACSSRGSSCYYETRTCDLNRKNCVVTSRSGDLALGTDSVGDLCRSVSKLSGAVFAGFRARPEPARATLR